MKIVCESCGAKYSIADERVSGKMFKIRCKRCSEVIVVRGDQQAQPVAAVSPAPAPVQDAIWHVVVEGEQAGPYAPAQLGEMLTNGSVDWDAYIWTEGFENWVPMRDVEDLVGQITGQPAQPEPAYRPQVQTLAGQPSMGADPFADESAANIPDPFAGAPAGNAGPDLFARGAARPAASPFNGGAEEPGVMSSSPSPRMSAERIMTGARNENSVLFSLKNLQALATGSPSAPPAIAGVGASSGFAGGEGSGLIDIRALATTTGVEGGQLPGHRDELISMGSQGGAFGTLGSPMLSPVGDDGDGGKKTIVWALVVGIGLVSAALVAAAYILRPAVGSPGAASVGVAPSVSAQGAIAAQTAVAAAPVPTSPARVEAPSEGELAAKRAADEQDKAREGEKSANARSSSTSSSSDRHHKHSSDGTSAKATGAGESAAATPQPEVKKAPAKSGPRSIDDLLDGALQGSSSAKGSHGAAETEANSNLPTQPSREEVMSAMSGVKSAVQACAKGAGGVATVTVNVAGATGRVTTAEVNGVPGPAGSCIAQAVRKAQFGKFSQRVFKITFPYKL